MPLKDWITVVKNGILNGDKIIEAMIVAAKVKNGSADISAEAIAEIMKRKEICKTCPFNSENAPKHGLAIFDLPFTHCIFCKCRIGADDSKEYCLSCQCGITEWNKHNPDKELSLKWDSFEQK